MISLMSISSTDKSRVFNFLPCSLKNAEQSRGVAGPDNRIESIATRPQAAKTCREEFGSAVTITKSICLNLKNTKDSSSRDGRYRVVPTKTRSARMLVILLIVLKMIPVQSSWYAMHSKIRIFGREFMDNGSSSRLNSGSVVEVIERDSCLRFAI